MRFWQENQYSERGFLQRNHHLSHRRHLNQDCPRALKATVVKSAFQRALQKYKSRD